MEPNLNIHGNQSTTNTNKTQKTEMLFFLHVLFAAICDATAKKDRGEQNENAFAYS